VLSVPDVQALYASELPKLGWTAPVVLVDGRAATVWEHARAGNRLRIKVEKFGPLSRRVIAGIHEEAQDLARFLGLAGGDVEIS